MFHVKHYSRKRNDSVSRETLFLMTFKAYSECGVRPADRKGPRDSESLSHVVARLRKGNVSRETFFMEAKRQCFT